MIDLELFGSTDTASVPSAHEARELCTAAAARLGVAEGHVAIEFVGERRIAELNREYRHKPEPTDVLSFPIDGVEPMPSTAEASMHAGDGAASDVAANGTQVPRELGDIVICPEQTRDLREAIVHGMLHLLGMDHETDDGEMLALQHELLRGPAQ